MIFRFVVVVAILLYTNNVGCESNGNNKFLVSKVLSSCHGWKGLMRILGVNNSLLIFVRRVSGGGMEEIELK